MVTDWHQQLCCVSVFSVPCRQESLCMFGACFWSLCCFDCPQRLRLLTDASLTPAAKPFEALSYTAQLKGRWTQQQGSLPGPEVTVCTCTSTWRKNSFRDCDRLFDQTGFFFVLSNFFSFHVPGWRETDAHSDDWVSSLWCSCHISI